MRKNKSPLIVLFFLFAIFFIGYVFLSSIVSTVGGGTHDVIKSFVPKKKIKLDTRDSVMIVDSLVTYPE